MKEKVTIYGKQYSIEDIRKIVRKNNDPILEYLGEELDYICDNSTVRFFKEYEVKFRHRETGQIVDILVRYYPDDKSEELLGDDCVYYHKLKDDGNEQ